MWIEPGKVIPEILSRVLHGEEMQSSATRRASNQSLYEDTSSNGRSAAVDRSYLISYMHRKCSIFSSQIAWSTCGHCSR